MQRENKWQDRFDEKFEDKPIDILGGKTVFWLKGTERGAGTQDVAIFIQSEIDRAVAEERKKSEKLSDYTEHRRDCIRNQFVQGEP